MPLEYVECFGDSVSSPGIADAVRAKRCPFVDGLCNKRFRSRIPSGACTLALSSDKVPVVCCPKRLYAESYQVLRNVSAAAFGSDIPLVLEGEQPPGEGDFAVVFGQKQGNEIRVPYRLAKTSSKFSVDWIVARVSPDGELQEFVAAEVQTIDTTGNYQRQHWDIVATHDPESLPDGSAPEKSSSSFNYENVNKRILPQIITKGHILRREPLCKKGLFFICPSRVLEHIITRVGELPAYPMQTGAVTLMSYQLGEASGARRLPLVLQQVLTTTTEQLSLAFSSPKSLPEPGVYETAIRFALDRRLQNG